MVRMSRTLGTRSRITGSGVSRQAAKAGNAEFLDPLAGMEPARGVPPWIWKRSNLCVFLGLECYGQFTASLGQ